MTSSPNPFSYEEKGNPKLLKGNGEIKMNF
jgi:hypothetical protein